ncbi:MAG: NAD(P)/FAD-dependent oxidoreductase [Thermoflexales bacterium]|nr:NAD(P)/FAD-dependent oxidoreductase [Thermoflexales bacterium]
MEDKSTIIIIGAGFAGLAAGIYGQMNGYQTQIFEMHDKPGGLCTAWTRKGYTIDGCIHWLVGSSPKSGMYRYWQEVGIAQGREFVNMDEYMRYEGADGRTLIFYTDVDRLEKHMLEFSPQDAELTRQFIQGIRMCLDFDPPPESGSALVRLRDGLKMVWFFATRGRQMQEWMKITAAEFAARFQDPVLRSALVDMWFPDFSMLFMLFTFAYLHNKNAGYPLGGSMPMSRAMAQRYLDLGGVIHYNSRVEKILVEDERATGVRLADGSEHRAGRVISAADGHTTIFKMLDGKYADDKTREPYERWPLFPSLLYVGVGVNRTFAGEAQTVSGLSFPLRQPTEIGDALHARLPVHIFNQDPNLAPAGKTSLSIMLNSSYEYWKDLAQDRAAYDEKKDQVARTVVELLEQRFPGISGQVEMVDVATPLTFERYTGNWKGTFEGWLITPQNAHTMMKPMSLTLPGLQDFYMCGQWVQPGGGLPTGVMLGRRLTQTLCKQDGKKFQTTV